MTAYNALGGSENFRFIDRPLFGESSTRDRIINLGAIGAAGLFFSVTLLSALLKSSKPESPAKGYNIYFSICILILCLNQGVLIYWYRQGDLDPKFRFLIYSNTILILLFCICANLYIYTF